MIAVSMAISVQDAANYLRNVQTLSTAAIACSLVLQPNTTHPVSLDTPAMSAMASALDRSTAQFEKLCHQATDILAQLRPLLSAGGASEARTTGNTASNPDLLQAAAGALSLAAHNAVTNQQQTNITAQAAATMGVATLYSIDTASTGVATKEILDAATHSAPQVDTATPVA
jgi:hypothetical protein